MMIPVGRSSASMTPIQTGKEEAGLLIYGGCEHKHKHLGDCCRMDLEQQPCSWVCCPRLELMTRLKHACVALDSSQVMFVGGVNNTADYYLDAWV